LFQSWRLRMEEDLRASSIRSFLMTESARRKGGSSRQRSRLPKGGKQIHGRTRVELSDVILLQVIVWTLMDIGGSKFPVSK
jgi:hypothetical protein